MAERMRDNTGKPRRRRTGRPSFLERLPQEVRRRLRRLILGTDLGAAGIWQRLDLDRYQVNVRTLRRHVARQRRAAGLTMANTGRSGVQQRINVAASTLLAHLEATMPEYIVDGVVRRLAFMRFVDVDAMQSAEPAGERADGVLEREAEGTTP